MNGKLLKLTGFFLLEKNKKWSKNSQVFVTVQVASLRGVKRRSNLHCSDEIATATLPVRVPVCRAGHGTGRRTQTGLPAPRLWQAGFVASQ
jgi:hypothetical protein